MSENAITDAIEVLNAYRHAAVDYGNKDRLYFMFTGKAEQAAEHAAIALASFAHYRDAAAKHERESNDYAPAIA